MYPCVEGGSTEGYVYREGTGDKGSVIEVLGRFACTRGEHKAQTNQQKHGAALGKGQRSEEVLLVVSRDNKPCPRDKHGECERLHTRTLKHDTFLNITKRQVKARRVLERVLPELQVGLGPITYLPKAQSPPGQPAPAFAPCLPVRGMDTQ